MRSRIERFYSGKITRLALFGVLFLLILLPQFNLVELKADGGTIPVSVSYLFSLIFAPWMLLNIRRWRLPPWYITGLFAFVMLYTLVADFTWGFGRTILNWIFGAYLLVVIVTMGCDFSFEDWQRAMGYAMLAFAAIELVNVLLQLSGFAELSERIRQGNLTYYRPRLVSLTRGGPNLDASWLALGCFFMRKKPVKIGYWLFCAAFSVLYFSRVGVISSGLYLIWAMIWDEDWRPNKKNIYIYLAAAIVILFLLWKTRLLEVLIKRFTGASNKGDVLAGRGGMWKNAGRMFLDNPFGYGCGNAMRVMKQYYGFASYEDNMHNVFLQFLMDEGFIGALWYLGLWGAFLWKEGREGFRHPLAGYFFTYFVLALVQYHGGEVQMQFVLGVYLCVRVLKAEPWPLPNRSPILPLRKKACRP